MRNFLHSLQERVLLYDGAKGVLLQAHGLKGDEAAESWNLLKPDVVKGVYRQYIEAGSAVIQTNTFPGNAVTLQGHGLAAKVYEINYAGVKLAKEVAGEKTFVAASVGPTGLFFVPVGELTFTQAYQIFQEQLAALAEAGADLVNFETFTDLQELRVAILAAKEKTQLPIIASLTFGPKNSTMAGNPAEVCAIVCEALGVAAVGANCSGGPQSLLVPIKKMSTVATVPLVVKANAGLPETVQGRTIYKETPEQFAAYTKAFVESGVRLIGGCCGTTPAHIRAIKRELEKLQAPPLKTKKRPFIASAYRYFDFSQNPNPTVQKLALKDFFCKANGLNALLDLAQSFDAEGIDYLVLDFTACSDFDVWEFVSNFSFSVRVPVVIKSHQPHVLTEFLKYYPGRAGVILTEAAAAVAEKLVHYGAYVLHEA